MVAGIPTTYRYNAMRSRLEARWAVFFDLIGWPWTYEPLDADGYIPDFLIHGPRPFFVEVGPCISQADYEAKAAKAEASAATLGHDLLILGVSPVASLVTSWEDRAIAGGWLGEFFPAEPSYPEWAGWSFGPAMWANCGHIDHRFSVWHDSQHYACRPCNFYPGNRAEWPKADDLSDLWAQAGSRVQWKPAG